VNMSTAQGRACAARRFMIYVHRWGCCTRLLEPSCTSSCRRKAVYDMKRACSQCGYGGDTPIVHIAVAKETACMCAWLAWLAASAEPCTAYKRTRHSS
jgi:hypothetical protein